MLHESSIRCSNAQLDAIFPRVKNFMLQDITEYDMFGTRVRGYRTPDTPSIWIRDYSDMMRGFRYWEQDMKSVVDHFAETQTARGWIFDYFTMTPEKVPCERENWAKYVRVPVEADVEYRFIKAIALAWQATGDQRWLTSLLPAMEKALHYVRTDPWRWDKATGLVKRAFTMDTWDFDYTAGRVPWLNFQISENTYWGIMHGDNSGYYEAFVWMSRFYKALGKQRQASSWATLAARHRARANAVCYNGRFYTHHVHLVPVAIEGVNEAEQLTLSNPMDINRGLATHAMAVSIIKEYIRREKAGGTFAAWFSVDPPFPDGIFGDEKLVAGAYCNGGIMPLVGGELARAAFEHGFERYAVEQLQKYEQLTRNNETYLWYFPDGRSSTVETSTSPDASPTDAWGSSAMVYALVEGLAGVVDADRLLRHVRLAPRWVAADCDTAEVTIRYGASGSSLSYAYEHDRTRKTITLVVEGKATVDLHQLLPPGTRAVGISVNKKRVRHATSRVEQSTYADASFTVKQKALVQVAYDGVSA